MGRESSHGTKELFNLPPLVLKAIGTWVALPFAGDIYVCLSRHWDGFSLSLGLVVEDKPTEHSCM